MPTLAIVQVEEEVPGICTGNTLSDNTDEEAMTGEWKQKSNEPCSKSKNIITTVDDDKTDNTEEMQSPNKKKRNNVTPSEEKEAGSNSRKEKKRTKTQPTLTAFFGAKKSVASPQADGITTTDITAKKSQISGSKREKTPTKSQTSTGANKRKSTTPDVRSHEKSKTAKEESPAAELSSPGGPETIKPRNIFSQNRGDVVSDEEAKSPTSTTVAASTSSSNVAVENEAEKADTNQENDQSSSQKSGDSVASESISSAEKDKVGEKVDGEELQQNLVGTLVSKLFDGKPFKGEVIAYDSKDKFYKIRYEDGDEEELEYDELRGLLVSNKGSMEDKQKKGEEESTSSKESLKNQAVNEEKGPSASAVDEIADNAIPVEESNKEEGKFSSDAIDDETNASADELPEERKQLLHKNTEMRKRYLERACSLVSDAKAGIEEENFEVPPLKAGNPVDQEFPDTVVQNMALVIEGSHLPLSKLVSELCTKLEENHSKKWSEESVTAKVKVLAKRGAIFSSLASSRTKSNIFEDEDGDRMWRWEVITIDLLPPDVVSNVKKARSARKKLSSNHAALMKLLQTLDNAEKSIYDLKVKDLDTVTTKVSTDEEKVLKFEREAEKKRLALQAKRKKQEEQDAKRREKERIAEEKRRAKELKKEEAEKKRLELERKKQEQADAREAAKRQKLEEKERLEQEKRLEEEKKKESLNKQKKTFMSFFSGPKKPKPKKLDENKQSVSVSCLVEDKDEKSGDLKIKSTKFDVDKFRSEIDSYESHASIPHTSKDPAGRSLIGRKRRTPKVDVSVYVTVVLGESNPFDAQPFAELKTLRVPNKYRFFSFHEDMRPPYHGTWSKKSFIVTGRRPFAKDTSHLDYDYDSEAEWEEGDDEMGEDVEDEAKNQEEDKDEGDDRLYDYDDGFCVADDKYLETDENVDDEDKELYKKKLQVSSIGNAPIAVVNKIRVIAPLPGGIPYRGDVKNSAKYFEGVEKKELQNVLDSLRGKKLCDPYMCLDAFSPPLNEEGVPKQDVARQTGSQSNGNDDYTKEEMKTLVRFIHLNTLNSKAKIIEELRKDHIESFGSRAKVERKLDSIATKKRNPNAAGVYWEVKREVLEELGLQDLIQQLDEFEKKDPEAAAKSKVPQGCASKSTKGKKRVALNTVGPTPNSEKKKGASKSTKGKKRVALDTVGATPNSEKKKAKTTTSSPSSQKNDTMTASANLMANFFTKKAKSDPTKENEA